MIKLLLSSDMSELYPTFLLFLVDLHFFSDFFQRSLASLSTELYKDKVFFKKYILRLQNF